MSTFTIPWRFSFSFGVGFVFGYAIPNSFEEFLIFSLIFEVTSYLILVPFYGTSFIRNNLWFFTASMIGYIIGNSLSKNI